MSLILIALFIVLGLASGLIAGLLGIGGSGILVPFAVLIFTLHGLGGEHVVHMAIATSLATVVFTSISSIYQHQKQGDINWSVVLLIVPGIVIGSWFGPMLSAKLSSSTMAFIFGAFTAATGTHMIWPKKSRVTQPMPSKSRVLSFFLVLGAFVGFIGTTGTSIINPYLDKHGLPINKAVGTTSVISLPVALIASLGFVYNGWNFPDLPQDSLGFVYWPALLCMACGSVVAAPFGARLSRKLSSSQSHLIFSIMLYCVSIYMLWKAFAG